MIPYSVITPIPESKPAATSDLWNVRYTQIDENFQALDNRLAAREQEIVEARGGASSLLERLDYIDNYDPNADGSSGGGVSVMPPHNHGTRYAPKVHTHETQYASLSHTHDGDHALADHDHNSVYSPKSHTHPGLYAAKNHVHSTDTSSIFADPFTPNIFLNRNCDPALNYGSRIECGVFDVIAFELGSKQIFDSVTKTGGGNAHIVYAANTPKSYCNIGYNGTLYTFDYEAGGLVTGITQSVTGEVTLILAQPLVAESMTVMARTLDETISICAPITNAANQTTVTLTLRRMSDGTPINGAFWVFIYGLLLNGTFKSVFCEGYT